MIALNSDYLEHYGVKGQKWGVITKEYVPTGRKSVRSNSYGSLGPKPRGPKTYESLGPKQRQNSNRLTNKSKMEIGRKWLLGLGLVLGTAIIGYGAYKTGAIKNDYISKYKEEAQKLLKTADRYRKTGKRLGGNSNFVLKEEAKKLEERAKKYSEYAKNANRRKAVVNYINNKGHIKI